MGKGFPLRRRSESEKTAAQRMAGKVDAFLGASCLMSSKDPEVILRYIPKVQKTLEELEEAADACLAEKQNQQEGTQ